MRTGSSINRLQTSAFSPSEAGIPPVSRNRRRAATISLLSPGILACIWRQTAVGVALTASQNGVWDRPGRGRRVSGGAPPHRAAEKLHGIAPFRMFSGGATCGGNKGATRACPARRAHRCSAILRAPSYTLQSWHIFVQGPLRAISWMLSSTSEKRGSSFADFALFSARGACSAFSPRPFLPRGAFCQFLLLGLLAAAPAGTLFLRRLAGRGRAPARRS